LTAKSFKFKVPPDTEIIDGIPMLMGPALGKGGDDGAEPKPEKPLKKPPKKGGGK
jgi:hypothetical protein